MHTIGVLMPDIRGYHYSDIVMAIEEYAYSKNFDIMLALPKWEIDIEKHVLDQCSAGKSTVLYWVNYSQVKR